MMRIDSSAQPIGQDFGIDSKARPQAAVEPSSASAENQPSPKEVSARAGQTTIADFAASVKATHEAIASMTANPFSAVAAQANLDPKDVSELLATP